MKKRFIIILFTFILLLTGGYVQAASFKITASTGQVNPDGTFTVSVGGDCIGRVNLSVNNGTLSTNSVWVEQNYQTVKVKAGSSGSVTVTATPVEGFSDADANLYKPGAKSVKVTINANNNTTNNNNNSTSSTKPNTKPSNNQTSTKPQTVIEEKSSNNLLTSLSCNIGTLEPNFDANISEYSVKLPKDTQTISIHAVTQDSKASIKGAGEIKLEVGENVISVTVVAENGQEKVYTIKAYVDETPQVYLKYRDTQVGVVRNFKEVAIPEGFQKKQLNMDEYEVSVFDNEHFSIIYGIDTEGNKNFYTIDTEKNECTHKIIPITIDKHFFFLGDWEEEREGFQKDSITIQEKEMMGYRFKDGFEDYFLLSVMNRNGEIVDYLYETKEGTLQLYLNSAPINYAQYEELINEIKNERIVIVILATVLVLSIGSCIFLFWKMRKGKLNEEIH